MRNFFYLFPLFVFACVQQQPQQVLENVVSESIDSISNEVNDSILFHRFKLNSVAIAPKLLKTHNLKYLVEVKLNKPITYLPKELSQKEYVFANNNALIQTLQECYDEHRPLILSPDVIWLTICQGVSIHVNKNYTSLSNVIFKSKKPSTLKIRNDKLNEDENQWKQVIEALALETQKYTKADYYSFFVPKFTTTSAIEKTAYEITLLETYKKSFQYVTESGCGIPSVTIEGSAEDWNWILENLEKLNDFGLGKWKNELTPIIKEFAIAAEGKPNVNFWKRMYKVSEEYAIYYISGWIIKFFPYIKIGDEEIQYNELTDEVTHEIHYEPNPFLYGSTHLLSTLSTDDFPSGISKVKIVWNNYFNNTTQNVVAYSGFLAIEQFEDKSLKPLIGWALGKHTNQNIYKGESVSRRTELKQVHKDIFWTPRIITRLTDSAFYNPKKFKTRSESTEFVKNYISEQLEKSNFQTSLLKGDTLQIVVLQNGEVHQAIWFQQNDEKLNQETLKILRRMPGSWFPAVAYPEEAMMLMLFPKEKEKKYKIKVNSRMEFVFD